MVLHSYKIIGFSLMFNSRCDLAARWIPVAPAIPLLHSMLEICMLIVQRPCCLRRWDVILNPFKCVDQLYSSPWHVRHSSGWRQSHTRISLSEIWPTKYGSTDYKNFLPSLISWICWSLSYLSKSVFFDVVYCVCSYFTPLCHQMGYIKQHNLVNCKSRYQVVMESCQLDACCRASVMMVPTLELK